MMVLSGMSDMPQLIDNTGYMQSFKPLDEKEHDLVREAAKMIRKSIAIPCTACSYCTDGCPMNIPIPDYFTLYNADKKKDYRPSRDKYEAISNGRGLASECISCGQCEGVCPQKLPIIENLKKVSMHFEKK